MPGQADHCGVGVKVGDVGVIEGMAEGGSVGKGVEVGIAVGMEINVAVSVGITCVSVGSVGDELKPGLGTPKLHALRRDITTATKNNTKKCLISIRMLTSIWE
jgi:hypothetical protein